jgi:hypothetical protein
MRPPLFWIEILGLLENLVHAAHAARSTWTAGACG